MRSTPDNIGCGGTFMALIIKQTFVERERLGGKRPDYGPEDDKVCLPGLFSFPIRSSLHDMTSY